MPDKNDSSIVAHLPKDYQLAFERLAELEGSNKSEKARELIIEYVDKKEADFNYMKAIFEK